MDEAQDGPLLATYGTLLRGMGWQERLGGSDAFSFVAPCRFDGGYALDSFPGAGPDEGTVQAELFCLRSDDVWPVLDRYEGYVSGAEHRSLFVPRRPPLRVAAETTAWVYGYTGPTANRPRVPQGDWRAYVAEAGAQAGPGCHWGRQYRSSGDTPIPLISATHAFSHDHRPRQ